VKRLYKGFILEVEVSLKINVIKLEKSPFGNDLDGPSCRTMAYAFHGSM